MKLNELKGLKGAMGTEMGKALPNVDPSAHGQFMDAAADMMRNMPSESNESNIIKKPIKKGLGKKVVSKTKMKLPTGKLFSIGKTDSTLLEVTKKEIEEISKSKNSDLKEKWSEKYKKSIDCNNPKGFSQKAHCQGRNKKSEENEATGAGSAGGFLGPVGFDPNSDFVKKSFSETPKKIEANEATGSASSGSYVTPAAWAKSTSKKHWRGKSKTQIPGGKFVQVKKKCKKFPYCNQGDITSLKLTNEEILEKAIKNVSKREGISENLIKQILLQEYNKIK